MLQDFEALFGVVRSAIEQSIPDTVEARPLFSATGNKLDGRSRSANTNWDPAPAAKPVIERWLDVAVAAAPAPWDSIALAVAKLDAGLSWQQSYPDLDSTPELESFRAHYSWAPLALPSSFRFPAPYVVDDALVGLTLQAPGVLYPHHHHKAPELYGVISGTLDWQVGDQPWRSRRPGDVILHRPSESHSMRTLDEPALTWAIWPSGTDGHVYMPSFDPPDQTTEPRRYQSD